jgi:hypothetical protein
MLQPPPSTSLQVTNSHKSDVSSLTSATDPALGDIAGYDPSYEYHDYSTAQIWLGRTKKSVGSVIGSELYGTVYKLLDHGCPDNARHACLQPPGLGFTTNCMVHPPAGMERCKFQQTQLTKHFANLTCR